ncbi:MAG: hypothetical protein AB1631_06455 [Acidobacteriota bacterium]
MKAFQHIYTSAERGYFPHQGRGFQTVALSSSLVGTEDLKTLERAAFYSVSAHRRRANDLPVKETFFHLPSGALAAGRIIDSGADSMGREGNYLSHHIVFSKDDFLRSGANPFALLDALTVESDLAPRDLPPVEIRVADDSSPRPIDVDSDFAASLVVAVADKRDNTALLIGKEAETRNALRWLISCLAREERMRMTFSTHFYECHNLRSLFCVAAVGSRAEAPAQRQDYLIFDFDAGEFPRLAPVSHFSAWLAESVRAGRWDEIRALNDVLNELRHCDRVGIKPPVGKLAVAALWEKAGPEAARAIAGDARLTIEFLKHAPKDLADAILNHGSPSELCGEGEEASQCLSSLRASASAKAWRTWAERWKADTLLAHESAGKQPWWRRLRPE